MTEQIKCIMLLLSRASVVSIACAAIVVTAARAAEKEHHDHHQHEAAHDTAAAAHAWSASAAIDDDAVLRRLTREAEALVRAGKTLTNWTGQIESRQSSVKLEKRSRRKLQPAELAVQAERAVVVVGTLYICDKCTKMHTATATGFFISDSGAVATSQHVLANYLDSGRGIVVMTRDGSVRAISRVLACDERNDVVVLQAEGRAPATLSLSPDALPGTPVTVISHPDQHFFMTTTGVVARLSSKERKGRKQQLVSITADFAKGSSGAPVLDDYGNVIALVNNTHSVYYHEHAGKPGEHLQMVVKNCTPASGLLELVTGTDRNVPR